MRYRTLGNSDLRVSTLCLGTMMFGGQTESRVAQTIVNQARAAGVNFIDTADVYHQGAAEVEVGRNLARDRQDWILATKVGNAMGDDPDRRGLSPRWIGRALEDSLRRLGTDYVDIYYLHREDHETPLSETVEALGRQIATGKIRYFGVSNFRAWRVAELCNVSDRLGVPRPVVSQPYYNALNRIPEVEHLPACGYYGLGVVPYSPLARGVLTGKYAVGDEPPPDTRAGRKDRRMLESEWREESLVIAQRIKAHTESRGVDPIGFALTWVLNNKFVTSVIAGPRTEEQWEDYLAGLEYEFTSADETFMDSLVAPGHPSTPGYTDPRYPIEGRVPRTGMSSQANG